LIELKILVDFSLVILIWLVQIIIYPSFLYIDSIKFKDWHQSYMQKISFFVIPLMFIQLGLSFFSLMKQIDLLSSLHLLFIILSWCFTFFLSVPLHQKLTEKGFDELILKKLIQTNFPRSLTWTMTCIISSASFILSKQG